MIRSADKLFARFQKTRSPRVLGQVYDLVVDELSQVAIRLARDPGEAEDLIQLTFITAIERVESFRAGQKLMPWLLGILSNHARSATRRRQRSPEPDWLLERSPLEGEPSRAAERAEFSEEVERLVQGLEEPYRAVIVLRVRHGLGVAEIADALGRPPTTVRSQLTRGIEILRRRAPAGLLGAGLLGLTMPRGWAQVRDQVLLAAQNALPASASLSLPGGLVLTGVFAMKKTLLACAALLTALVTVIALPPREAQEPTALEREALESVTLEALGPLESVAEIQAQEPDKRAEVVPDESIVIEPPKAAVELGSLRVRISDQQGAPLADELCILRRRVHGRNWSREWQGTSGGDGSVTFQGLEPGYYSAQVLRGDRDGTQVLAGLEAGLSLSVNTESVLRGEVRGPSDQPIPGARIWVSDGPSLQSTYVLTHADRAGRFELRGLKPDLFLGASAPGFAKSASYSPDPRGEILLRLEREGAAVSGRVLDSQGEPLVQAEVILAERAWLEQGSGVGGEYLPGPPPSRAFTDSEGRFELAGAWLGEHLVQARAKGYSVLREPLTVGSMGVADLELRLVPEATLVGQLLDPAGRPVAKAGIHTEPLHTFQSSMTVSSKDGHFVLGGLPSGETTVVVDTDVGILRQVITLGAGEVLEQDLQLEAAPRIRGRLVGSAGEPLAGWLLTIKNQSTRAQEGSEVSKGSGEFVFHVEEGTPYLLQARPPGDPRALPLIGFRGLRSSYEIQELVIDARAQQPARIRLKALLPNGDPAVGATLAVWHETVEAYRALDVSDPGGDLLVDGLAAGSVVLRLSHPDHPEFKLEKIILESGQELDLGDQRFPASGRVKGRVSGVDIALLEGLELHISNAEGNGTIERSGMEFHSSPLAPGQHLLVAKGDFLSPIFKYVRVTAGQDTQVDLDLERVGLRRVIVTTKPNATLYVGVQVWDATGKIAWSGTCEYAPPHTFEGRISVEPGTYRMVLLSSDGQSFEHPLEVLGIDGTQEPLRITAPDSF